jgi:hypothetical protein
MAACGRFTVKMTCAEVVALRTGTASIVVLDDAGRLRCRAWLTPRRPEMINTARAALILNDGMIAFLTPPETECAVRGSVPSGKGGGL